MKIISWNLLNIGNTKLGKALNGAVVAGGLGNTVLDYIVKMATGDPAWNNICTTNPADIFVVIELKTGGTTKGNAANGTSIPTLANLVNAMNVAVTARNLQGQFVYASAPAEIVGYHECVGVIYNTLSVQVANNGALRDNNGNWIGPRTPYLVRFTTVAPPNTPYNIIGIHAPPPKAGADRFKAPILFAQRIADVPEVINNAAETVLIMGDFNCNPS
ncbi:MAG: hypothetical protein ACRC3B_01470, partial [Bacteroidia bacterium]